MKNQIIFVFLFPLLFVSCKDEPCSRNVSTIFYTINGKPDTSYTTDIRGMFFIDSNNTFSFVSGTRGLNSVSGSGTVKEFVSFRSIKKTNVVQKLVPAQGWSFEAFYLGAPNFNFGNVMIGGDTPCEWFVPDSTYNDNYIQITRMNADTSIVDGVFNMKLVKSVDCPDRDYPDTLMITKGRFHLKIK